MLQVNAPASHLFERSGLRIDVDLEQMTYRLGGVDPADGEFKQSGPLPTEVLEGFSSAPEYAPGWYIALGNTYSIGTTVVRIEASHGVRQTRPSEPDWTEVDYCILTGSVWAAELFEDQRWLRVTTPTEEIIWHRRHRVLGTDS